MINVCIIKYALVYQGQSYATQYPCFMKNNKFFGDPKADNHFHQNKNISQGILGFGAPEAEK